jgi:SRSO17 transposase
MMMTGMASALSIANRDASLPVAYQLYLLKDWASDRNRRHKVGIPDEIGFKTKPEIALAQIRWACERRNRPDRRLSEIGGRDADRASSPVRQFHDHKGGTTP